MSNWYHSLIAISWVCDSESVSNMLILLADYELSTEHNDIKNYLEQFTKTFCRHYNQDHVKSGGILGVQVYFLELFDTVNSVSIFELPKKTTAPPKMHGTARYIRHAVAVDEARVKFKPALLVQDRSIPGLPVEDIKEARSNICYP